MIMELRYRWKNFQQMAKKTTLNEYLKHLKEQPKQRLTESGLA